MKSQNIQNIIITGDKYYYSDGTISSRWNHSKTFHREDGPAYEGTDGTKYWYMNGKCHREDGPAIEYADGTKHWYMNDKKVTTLTKKELIKYMELNNLTLAHLLTDSDKMVRASAAKCKWKKV